LRLRTLLVLGVVIRVSLAPFLAHTFDVYAWYIMAMDIVRTPFAYVPFPPMLYYTFFPFAYLYDFLSREFGFQPYPMVDIPPELNPYPQMHIAYVTDPVFNVAIKLPFILADVASTYLLYNFVLELRHSESLAEASALLFFLNPYLIWISSAWGMFDSLPAFFSLASLVLLHRRRLTSSAISLSVATAYKLYPLLFMVPVLLFLRRQNYQLRQLVIYVLAYLVTLFALFLPRLTSYFGAMVETLHGLVTSAPAVGRSGFGLTYWSILLVIPSSNTVVVWISNSVLVFMLAAVTVVALKRRAASILTVNRVQLAYVLAVFLSFRFVPEQFFVWALPFMILAIAEERIEKGIYWAASAVALLYAVTNLRLPFYFLPLYPWIGTLLRDWMHWFYGAIARSPPSMAALPYVPDLFLGSAVAATLGTAFSLLMVIALLEILPERRRVILATVFGSLAKRCKIIAHSVAISLLRAFYHRQPVE